MEQIIKLTTQLANKAITEHIVASIIKEANERKDSFDFDAFFTPENLNEIFNQKMKMSEVKNLVGANSKKKKATSGKKRMNGYTFFAKSMRVEFKSDDNFKDATFKEINQELSKRWKSLSEDDKDEWKKKAASHNTESESESGSGSETESEAPKPAPPPEKPDSPEPVEENPKKANPKKLKKKVKKQKKVKKSEEKPNKAKFTMDDVDDMFD